MPELSHEHKIKIVQFELSEARWLHEEVLRNLMYKWVDRIIVKVVEYNKYGMIGRLFHFCVEYFYISKFLKIRIQRSRHNTFLGGKGYRPGMQKTRLDAISTIVTKRGKEIAKRQFPIGIIQ